MYTVILLYLHLTSSGIIVTLYLFDLMFLLPYKVDSGSLQLKDWVLRTCHSIVVTEFCTWLFPYNYVLPQKTEDEPLPIQYGV